MMRRIATLVAGLVLVAGTVQAQKPVVTATADSAVQASGRIVEAWDSLQYQVRVCARSSKGVAITATGHCTSRTLAWYLRPKSPPPPPADSTKDSTVTPPPNGVTPLFSSDWSGGLLDGAKWTRWGGQGILAVVPATGRDFPTANVLRVQMGTGSFDWVEADGKWTVPAVGESRAFRLYYRNEIGAINGGWSATHPVESKGTDGGISGAFYTWKLGSRSDGRGQWAFQTTAGYPRNLITLADRTGTDIGTLTKNVTYRVEWKWTRTGASAYTLALRISDPSGKVVADNTTLYPWGSSQPLSTQATGFPLADWAVTGVRVGLNGGFSASGTHYVYYGGFAVCTDWCGAY